MNICLHEMSRQHFHEFYQDFSYDSETFANAVPTYYYDKETVNALYDKHMAQGKLHFAIILNEAVIGDVYLKNIDQMKKTCEMGIHMTNDSWKGKGYGTQAELLVLQYAFQKLEIQTVYADALIKNHRSRHVLEKVGFKEISRNDDTCFYRCDIEAWQTQ